ncbi:MAG: hypothetical protein DRI69_05750 [Bacteroidetes bacterium]|nr:MAG: hypothetical protein DRI69_05750 [Bacteroidota bacterium]
MEKHGIEKIKTIGDVFCINFQMILQ